MPPAGLCWSGGGGGLAAVTRSPGVHRFPAVHVVPPAQCRAGWPPAGGSGPHSHPGPRCPAACPAVPEAWSPPGASGQQGTERKGGGQGGRFGARPGSGVPRFCCQVIGQNSVMCSRHTAGKADVGFPCARGKEREPGTWRGLRSTKPNTKPCVDVAFLESGSEVPTKSSGGISISTWLKAAIQEHK